MGMEQQGWDAGARRGGIGGAAKQIDRVGKWVGRRSRLVVTQDCWEGRRKTGWVGIAEGVLGGRVRSVDDLGKHKEEAFIGWTQYFPQGMWLPQRNLQFD